MTAILNKIRMLEASRNSGALSEEDFERAKARLLDTVEDAVEPEPAKHKPAQRRANDAQPHPMRRQSDTVDGLDGPAADKNAKSVLPIILICAIGTVGMTGLVTLLTGDVTLALTLVVTIIAAITIRAMRVLDE